MTVTAVFTWIVGSLFDGVCDRKEQSGQLVITYRVCRVISQKAISVAVENTLLFSYG